MPQAGMTDAVGVKRQKAEIGKAESRNSDFLTSPTHFQITGFIG